MKIFLLVILVLAIILIALYLIAPKSYRVVRQVVIDKPNEVVFAYIRSLKAQNDWSVWSQMDPNVVNTYTGIDGQVGFVSAWEGNKAVGKGEQEIMKITEGSRVELELRFVKPFKSQAQVYIATSAISLNQTEVEWGMTGTMPFPMNLFLLFSNMDKSIGNDFEKGLSNLKDILEAGSNNRH